MKAIGVIPARWGSTRFEGKVLAEIQGKPMIQHVWERSKLSKLLDDVIIACDDKRVYDVVEGFGGQAVMTSDQHPSGTDRIAEAVKDIEVNIVVNIQGDEPLIDPKVIDDLAQALFDDEACSMATVAKILDNPKELEDPHIVKVVFDQEGYALYFSRSLIPYNREGDSEKKIIYYKQLGIYAYRKDFLLLYTDLPESKLEKIERLEQLRALEAGYKIRVVQTDCETIGVDVPEDLQKVERFLSN